MGLYTENEIYTDYWFVSMIMKHKPYETIKIINGDDELLERYERSRGYEFDMNDRKLVRDIRQKSFRNSYRKEIFDYPNGDEVVNGLKEEIEDLEDRLHQYREDVYEGDYEYSYDTEQDYLEQIDELKIMILIIKGEWMESSKYLGLLNEYEDRDDE
jgi:hypothetical protein